MLRLFFFFIFTVNICMLLFITADSIYYYCRLLKEFGKPQKLTGTFKESPFFVKVFRDFPRLLGRFFYESQNAFNDYGIVIFYGPQGCGKTMAVTHYAQKMCAKYPKARLGSNYNLLIQDFEVKGWKSVIYEKNEEQPIIFCIDELAQWANSRDWQKMPKNILSELCYQRKNKRLILGTAQSISQVDKQLRLQCGSGEYRRCFTYLGFITLVVRLKPDFDESGNLKHKRFLGFYVFLQDEVLRYLYDTMQVVERLSHCEVVNNDTVN